MIGILLQVIGNYHSVQDALFHITSRLRETIFPMKRPGPNNGHSYLPPFPEMPPPPFRPRHNPASPGSYPSPVGPFHSMDRGMGPSQPFDHQAAFSHGMDPMVPPNSDRIPFPYGSERPGHGPTFDRPPSPRSWTPQVSAWCFKKCAYCLNLMNVSLNIIDNVSFVLFLLSKINKIIMDLDLIL